MKSDKDYMELALGLAAKATSAVRTNPKVGAVVVKNSKVVGRGYHKYFGGPHAEIYALAQAGKQAHGASLYVTLEPCSRWGKTPPCCDAIIQSGIKEVVIAQKDPNPLNNGRGLRILKKAGIIVRQGVLAGRARGLNPVFHKFITKNMPYVILKAAQSLDGKIATRTGDSRWITNEKARQFAHYLRSQADAVLVGVETVLKDDPLLTQRLSSAKKQPVKVIVDSRLRVPLDAKILSKKSPQKTIIATTAKADKKKIKSLQAKNAQVIRTNIRHGKVDLADLLMELANMGVSKVLVEGGGNVMASLLEDKLADKAYFFVAPKIIGGRDAKTCVEGRGIDKIKKAIRLKNVRFRSFDGDLLIEGDLN